MIYIYIQIHTHMYVYGIRMCARHTLSVCPWYALRIFSTNSSSCDLLAQEGYRKAIGRLFHKAEMEAG